MTNISRIKLTQRAIDQAIATHESGKRKRYWFSDVPGLYLRITPNGCQSYCLRYERPGGGKGDYTIGQTNLITPGMAREAALEKLAELKLKGTDPCEARRTAHLRAQTRRLETFAALAEDFMAAPENRQLAKRTRQDRQTILNTYLLPYFGSRPVEAISRGDVRACLRAVQMGTRAAQSNMGGNGGNRTANKVHEVIRRIFNWSVEEERCLTNPAQFRTLFEYAPAKRSDILTDERVRIIWRALEDEEYNGWGNASVIAIKLCFITLQRPNEICQAHRDDFDFVERVWRISASRTKTNAVYEVPLSEDAAELFRKAFALSKREWAFVSDRGSDHLSASALTHRFGKTRRRLLKTNSLPSSNVQLYDARRFGRTMLVQRLGFPEYIAERVINHAPDRCMARTYDVWNYSHEIRRAHEVWTQELRRIVTNAEPARNVVPMTRNDLLPTCPSDHDPSVRLCNHGVAPESN